MIVFHNMDSMLNAICQLLEIQNTHLDSLRLKDIEPSVLFAISLRCTLWKHITLLHDHCRFEQDDNTFLNQSALLP